MEDLLQISLIPLISLILLIPLLSLISILFRILMNGSSSSKVSNVSNGSNGSIGEYLLAMMTVNYGDVPSLFAHSAASHASCACVLGPRLSRLGAELHRRFCARASARAHRRVYSDSHAHCSTTTDGSTNFNTQSSTVRPHSKTIRCSTSTAVDYVPRLVSLHSRDKHARF